VNECKPLGVGTALVYAFLDMKNIVGHAEMASRIFDGAQLPWQGLKLVHLSSQFHLNLSRF
jgi:hypothetical protein